MNLNHQPVMGRIFAEECFGTLDGPGIRYVCFLQGCLLDCAYCHNPESKHLCGGAAQAVSVDSLIDRILSYRSYWRYSGGGLTLSGGEPLLQVRFLNALLQQAKRHGIHTALDTSGAVAWSRVKGVVAQADLILLDIKAGDQQTAWSMAHLDLQRLREFIAGLNELGKEVWVRHVLVPGWNDSKRQLLAVAELSQQLQGLKRFELLGFHQMAASKWHRLERAYRLDGHRPASDQDLTRAATFFESLGLPVVSSAAPKPSSSAAAGPGVSG